MNKLVSIIVPVYNSVAFLDKCIQSITSQTYKNIELILVNDDSPDTSGEVCDKYASTDSRIKVIHKENGGLVTSRKAGISLATGEYVLYVDGDDWIEPELIERYMEQVIQYDADIVVSSHNVNLEGRVEILSNTLSPGVYDKNRLIAEVYPKMMYTGKFSQFGIFSYSWGKLYRREILIDNQLRVTEGITIGEDALCLYPTLLDANILVILDEPYYHYRQRADSLIKTLRTIEISKMEKVYMDLKEVFISKGVLDIMIEQLHYYLLSLLTVNTEGPVTADNVSLYPFNEVTPEDKIVLYGGGTFGQHVYKKVNNNKSHNIVAWIDERHQHYSKLNLPITGFDSLESLEYDVVLITLIDQDNSNQAFLQLTRHGVDPAKIIQVSHYSSRDVQNLLSQYKINL
jgi:glycosyltransferase involved in cell wall biosynthesis